MSGLRVTVPPTSVLHSTRKAKRAGSGRSPHVGWSSTLEAACRRAVVEGKRGARLWRRHCLEISAAECTSPRAFRLFDGAWWELCERVKSPRAHTAAVGLDKMVEQATSAIEGDEGDAHRRTVEAQYRAALAAKWARLRDLCMRIERSALSYADDSDSGSDDDASRELADSE